MKAVRLAGKILRVIAFVVIGLIVVVSTAVSVLYSPWAQRNLVNAFNSYFGESSSGLGIHVDELRLGFPLRLSAAGLMMSQDGDTMMQARSVSLSVNPFELLIGQVGLNGAALGGVSYKIGSPDSAMYMQLRADSLSLGAGSIRLAHMNIDVDHAAINGAYVGIVINPDTTPPTPPAPPTDMSINIHSIRLTDLTYAMRLMPSIDTLTAHIPAASLTGTQVDLFNQRIALGLFSGTGLDARYITPDSAAIAAAGPYPAPAPADTAVQPWVVTIDSLALTESHALYALSGAVPLPGLDFSYIEVDEVNLSIHDFYNEASTVRIPLRVSGTERCGVRLSTSGLLDIDSTALRLRDFRLVTAEGSQASFDVTLGMGDLVNDPSTVLAANLDAAFAHSDLGMLFPITAPYWTAIPADHPLILRAQVDGTAGELNINEFLLNLNGCVNLEADGVVENMMDPDRIGGDINLHGNIFNVNPLLTKMMAPEPSPVTIPPMALSGHVRMNAGVADGNLRATTRGGRLSMDGRWNSNREDYTLNLSTDSFPIEAFMPQAGFGAVTTSLHVTGHGYNPFKPGMELDGNLNIVRLPYLNNTFRNITADARIINGEGTVNLSSNNSGLDFDLSANGNLTGSRYIWQAELDARDIDLQALGMSAEEADLDGHLTADATLGPGKNDLVARLLLNSLSMRRATGTIDISGVDLHVNTNDSITQAALNNRDLSATFISGRSPSRLMADFDRVSTVLKAQMDTFYITVDSIQPLVPPFELTLVAGSSNMINDILAPSGMAIRSVNAALMNDSALSLGTVIRGLTTQTARIDSVFLNMKTMQNALRLNAGILNRPGNLDEWHKVNLFGTFSGNTLSLNLDQQNLSGVTGFRFGFDISALPDTTVILSVTPANPVIGYKNWSVNDGNFLKFNIPTKHLDADLVMNGERSSLEILTEGHEEADSIHDRTEQEDLLIRLKDIHIQDWIRLNPFAPVISGDVSADMRLNSGQGILMGMGEASISNFYYNRQQVADFSTHFNVAADRSGTLQAFADLYVDSVRTVTIRGALNDSTAPTPLSLDFNMIRFPLAVVNPFMPTGTARLSGVLNGDMSITGTSDSPIMNGYVDFDSTAVNVTMLGTPFTFSSEKIPVVNSVVALDSFAITGCNENPLRVRGSVDLSSLTDVKIDLALNAQNMMLVNSRRARGGADVYGKAYIDLDATVHGGLTLLAVDLEASILPETNVTYVLPPTQSAIVDRTGGDMVKFVNFSDTAAVLRADSLQTQEMMMFLNAALTIEQGSTISVDLSPDGKYKAQIQGNGTLTYDMTPMSEGRLTGRLNLDKGFVKYGVPPIVSDLLFNFDGTNYVTFSGNMMNPGLNLHAVDVVKANVIQNGQNSRLINFDVSIGVTGTLENMNVVFDVSTIDDIQIANELASMSPEQRASQAMNLLLYKTYTGPGSKTDKTMANSLYNFLAGQLNNWAANTIKGVDLTFGIDQYDRTNNGVSSSAMSYSYQMSKSLFNDRLKIVVGGNYTTDANADENFSQNLINDISLEYFLNNARTMYLRLFRHTGYESVLEGEITQTGVGFVYRRKLRKISHMFLPASVVRRRDERENQLLNNRISNNDNEDGQ